MLLPQVMWIETIILRQNVGCQTQVGKFQNVYLFNEVFLPVCYAMIFMSNVKA